MINIGVSSCLLGKKVRYNGGHKKNCYLTEFLAKYFKFVPDCPEVRAGFGIPREMMELLQHNKSTRIIGKDSGKDLTSKIENVCGKYISGLKFDSLCGYILKEESPTCGLKKLPVRLENGKVIRKGVGLFTSMIRDQLPLLPLVEADDFNDVEIRKNFIEQVYAYHRLQLLYKRKATYQAVAHFQSVQRLQLMTHSKKKMAKLDELLTMTKDYTPTEMRDEYAFLFMSIMRIKTSISKNVMVMRFINKTLQKLIDKSESQTIINIIDDYQNEQTPLIVPLTLLKYYVKRLKIVDFSNQVYLSQDPQEIMLCYSG